MDLPVVQRKNDNDYYLNHTFSHEESSEGALFLDGLNLLAPEEQTYSGQHIGLWRGDLRRDPDAPLPERD